MVSAINRATAGWGAMPPDWVVVLAEECDRTSQRRAAQRIGYSPSAVNQVLSGTYNAGLNAVETAVRGRLMGAAVDCPALGRIGRGDCLDWQARPFAAGNRRRVEMYRACRNGCPHSRIGGDS